MNRMLVVAFLLVPPLTIAGPAERIGITVELPANIEGQRAEYERLIASSRDEVLAWFAKSGLSIEAADLIDRAVVYPDAASLRQGVAKVFGDDPKKIPDTFSGTVNGKTLYVTSEEAFHPIWTKLYPDWPWSRRSYRSLVVHELAHRAHAYVSSRRTGSEDAMGPSWFFEGLAVMCARQFAAGEKPMNAAEILSHVGGSKAPKVSYPLYGRLVRSLALAIPVKTLVEKAAEPGFPHELLPVVNRP